MHCRVTYDRVISRVYSTWVRCVAVCEHIPELPTGFLYSLRSPEHRLCKVLVGWTGNLNIEKNINFQNKLLSFPEIEIEEMLRESFLVPFSESKQWPYSAWVQPMRDDVTLLCRLSLNEPIPEWSLQTYEFWQIFPLIDLSVPRMRHGDGLPLAQEMACRVCGP